MEGQRATGVRVQNTDGTKQDIQARVVVDASGQQTMLASKLGIREDDPRYRKAAVWGYYRNADRDPGEHGGATVILHTNSKKAWFWYIPLSNNITSIGVVSDNDYLLRDRGTPANVFEEELVNCPSVVSRLVNAELISDFRVAREFSYSTKQPAGEGWVLVGDALGFIDPIYSSGVYFALYTGEKAADAIIAGLHSDDLSEKQLGGWADGFQEGSKWIRKLVGAYYTNSFSFGRFMKSHPVHSRALTDLLIGRIFESTSGDIFDDMDPWIEEAIRETDGEKPAG
jgi:flavin-dependent dehydrogenase